MKKEIFSQLTWADIDPATVRHLIALARAEDMEASGMLRQFPHRGDLTTQSMVEQATRGQANLMARKNMVVCGTKLIPLVLETYGGDCRFEASAEDGQHLNKGECIGTLFGDASQMLQAERIILNFLQHLSGISTTTSRYVDALRGTETRILDTRKTTPGYRVLEKYAVACGGGWNHRMGLYHWILVKDNHLSSTSAQKGLALEQRIRQAKTRFPDVVVEVEVDEIAQIEPVLAARADIVMLDNFSNADLKTAVILIDGRAITEASGGVELGHLHGIAETGVNYISSGALIHQSQWIDIGLDWNN